MCVPLGGRGGRSHGGAIKTKISKTEVENILTKKSYNVCQWKRSRCRIYRDCDMSLDCLISALSNDDTFVFVANTYKEEYKRGYRTIVMKAPSIKATIIFRIAN